MAGPFFSAAQFDRVYTVFEWTEVSYNRQRCHSMLNYHAPVTFEEVLLLSCPTA